MLAALAVYRLVPVPAGASGEAWRRHPLYLPIASLGATAGAYLFGSLNLWLSGVDGLGRSIEGALAGAILAIEGLKAATGMRGSTGLRFAAPLAAAIVVGRIGCFLAGLEDMTYGTPTSLPWAVDFGDGIPRHPVQLYESASMALFLVALLLLLRRRHPLALYAGFYLFVGFYAAQRFLWEFLKPYGTVLGPLNLFHLLSLALLGYAVLYGRKEMIASCPPPMAHARKNP
ncbi:MAG TPA: prolipoprotein diacylglyceryl transferase family protein [Stellaceae bacterium]|nr:prolipoprotein diacylglyceryl transferase family protein [Stellaceae bacterium]